MKEATGELNMTVITVVAIAAVAAIFYAFVWPGIKQSIASNTCKTQCPSETSEKNGYDEACYKTCMEKNSTTINSNGTSTGK